MTVALDAVMRAVSAALEASGTGLVTRTATGPSSATGLAHVGEQILIELLEHAHDRRALEDAMTDRVEHPADPDSLGSLRWQVKKVLAADSQLATRVRARLIESGLAGYPDILHDRRTPGGRPSREPVSYGYDRGSKREDSRRCPTCGRTGPLSSRDSSTRTCSNGHTWDV